MERKGRKECPRQPPRPPQPPRLDEEADAIAARPPKPPRDTTELRVGIRGVATGGWSARDPTL